MVRIAFENTTNYIAFVLGVLMSKKKASAKATKSPAAKKKIEKVKAAKPAKKAVIKAKSGSKPVKAAKPVAAPVVKKAKVAATNSQVALKKEAKKKQDTAVKAVVDAGEVLDPGLLTKQQVKSLEKLIQKNAEWSLISGVLEANARVYKMHDSFQEKMAIKHPVLGLGYVTLAENHKMTVLFKDGSRNLIMNYKS